MAGKYKANNSEFLQKLQKSTKNDMEVVSQRQQDYEKIIKNTGKEEQQIDLELMDNAPEDWNFFSELKVEQPSKFAELKMSIYNLGVLQPLILWKQENDRYMILAGRNRRDASRDVIIDCQDEPGFDEKKFRYIKSIVYEHDELTEEEAQEIIIDTNYVQREYTPKTRVLITKKRMGILEKQRYSKGRSIAQLAKEMKIEKSAIYDNLAIGQKVIEPLQELYFDEKITKKAVLKFVYFDFETQQWILDNFAEQITDARVKRLKKSMKTKEEIEKVFTDADEGVKFKRLEVTIPVDRVEEFQKMLDAFLTK